MTFNLGMISSMEESEKYYTPLIEEFHAGFEFEFQGVDNYWNLTGWEKVRVNVNPKNNFGLYTLEHITNIIESDNPENHIRVKYLDQEDIESFGFEYEGGKLSIYGAKLFVKRLKFAINHDKIIRLEKTQKRIQIFESFEGGMDDDLYTIFNGIIRNKSELKQVLTQVGVLS